MKSRFASVAFVVVSALLAAEAHAEDPGTELPSAPPCASGVVAMAPGVSPLVLGGAVVTVVAAGAGVVFTVVSNDKAASENDQRTALAKSTGTACAGAHGTRATCSALEDTITAKNKFASAAFASFVLAGALGVGTGIYALVAPRRPPNPCLNAAPLIGPHVGGVVLSGAW
jgi:hypothetical protein